MNKDIELTKEEAKAIKALERLAKTWPQTLMIFGGDGIDVRKPDEKGNYGKSRIVAHIIGIQGDGGDSDQ